MTVTIVISKQPNLLLTSSVSYGSGRELPLSKFIAVKLPLEFRLPEAALGQ
jgi:hypothetical protein